MYSISKRVNLKNVAAEIYVKLLICGVLMFFYSVAYGVTISKNDLTKVVVENQQTSYPELYKKALTFFQDGKNKESLPLALEALELAKKKQNTQWLVQSYFLIGQLFNASTNNQKALDYFRQALVYTQKQDNLEETTNIYWKVGISHLKLKDLDSAQYYFEKIVTTKVASVKIDSIKAMAYGNLAGVFFKKTPADVKKGEEYALKGIKIYKENNHLFYEAAGLNNLAGNYYIQKQYSKAKKYYLEALNLLKKAKKDKEFRLKEAIYENLGWTLRNLGNPEGFDYINKSAILRDSLQKTSHSLELLKIEAKHNAEIAQKESVIAKKEEEKAKRLNYFLGGISVLLLLAVFVMYRNGKLKQQNREKALENKRQNKVIHATLDQKEAQEKKITQTLHDSVIQLLSSANLFLGAAKRDKPSQAIAATQDMLGKASKTIHDISDELVSVTLLTFGLPTAIGGLCEKYSSDTLTIESVCKELGRYQQDFEIMVYNIVHELLKNTVAHSHASMAMITLVETNQNLTIRAIDDGKGFDPKKLKEQHGIGLAQIEARSKEMQGTFRIDANNGKGTSIFIVLPIAVSE